MDKKLHPLWNDDDKPLMTPDEVFLLIQSIRKNHDDIKVAVELGCYAGRTSIILASELGISPDVRYYAVDNFAINGSSIRKDTIERFKKYSIITFMEMTTNKAAAEFFSPIDWLLIDADHQDHSILEDCQHWLPKVRSGGIVAFHDYFNPDFPSVARRVEETSAGWPVFGQVDSLMIKIKP